MDWSSHNNNEEFVMTF